MPAISPVTSLYVVSSYTSCFSSYVSSCCQFLYHMFFQLRPLMLPALIKLFLQLRLFVLQVFITAVSPVTSFRVASFYTSRFSSYVSSCFQFYYLPFLQSRLLVLPGHTSADSPVTALRVSSSYYTGCFSNFVSCFEQFLYKLFLQLLLLVLPAVLIITFAKILTQVC